MNSHKSHSLVPLPFRGPFPRWLARLQPASRPPPRFYYWQNRTCFSQGKPTCPVLSLTLPWLSQQFSWGPDSPHNPPFPHLLWEAFPTCSTTHLCLSSIGLTLILSFVKRTEVACLLWVPIAYLFSSLSISLFFFILPPFSQYWLSHQMNKCSIAE